MIEKNVTLNQRGESASLYKLVLMDINMAGMDGL